jgi:hypothetical protein
MTYWGPTFPPPMPCSEPGDSEEERHDRSKALLERPRRPKTLGKRLKASLQRLLSHSDAR